MSHVGGFLRVLWFSSTNKPDRHDVTEILLKVTLNTIKLHQTNQPFQMTTRVYTEFLYLYSQEYTVFE
jgi:hypothetical protein